MIFSAIILLMIWPARRIGWILSKPLYHMNAIFCVVLLTIWGGGLGFLIGTLDYNFEPFIVFKILFGFCGGLYMASPNFGMLDESTIPYDAMRRHKLISHYPQILFAVFFIIMFLLNYFYPR